MTAPPCVLTDGAYTIWWHGGLTFAVYLYSKEVNAFTVGEAPLNFGAAQQEAREWWYTGGKNDTQQVVRDGAW